MFYLPNRVTAVILSTDGWSVYVTQPKRKGTWVAVPDPAAELHYVESRPWSPQDTAEGRIRTLARSLWPVTAAEEE